MVFWSIRSGTLFFFFFQAEDGIRDLTVTGVQTCALPIYGGDLLGRISDHHLSEVDRLVVIDRVLNLGEAGLAALAAEREQREREQNRGGKIGRASCRERV